MGALQAGTDVSVIAEVKRRSPSKGTLNDSIDPARQAAAYRDGGARAISVLTENKHFGGSAADLETIGAGVRIPLLKKDFHVDISQVFEARALGAAAILLIARAVAPGALGDAAHDIPMLTPYLPTSTPATGAAMLIFPGGGYGALAILLIARAVAPGALGELAAAARELGIEPMIEVRDEHELASAIGASARVIGVNSRNLETLEIDAAVCVRIVPLIPRECIAVFESGVSTRRDVERAATLGATAVLVGSALSTASDPVEAVRALTGVARCSRG